MKKERKVIVKKQKTMLDSHVDVWRLEASLVDVVEGEGLSGVGAIFVYLHRCPVASLGLRLSLRLLPSRCHDL